MNVALRLESTTDTPHIRRLLESAFETDAEARLVDTLRADGDLSHAWVAEQAGRVVSFLGFSPVTIEQQTGSWLGLAPLATDPDFQRKGIGSKLTRHAVDHLRDAGVALIVVLGDPQFYRRFGFEPAGKWQLRDEYGGGDAFQAIVFDETRIPAGGGLVRYAPAFSVCD